MSLKRSRAPASEGKRGIIQELSLEEARKGAEFYVDFAPILNASYPRELAIMAKRLKVPQRRIRIIDHPCGELAVFVMHADGNDAFEGYLQELV